MLTFTITSKSQRQFTQGRLTMECLAYFRGALGCIQQCLPLASFPFSDKGFLSQCAYGVWVSVSQELLSQQRERERSRSSGMVTEAQPTLGRSDRLQDSPEHRFHVHLDVCVLVSQLSMYAHACISGLFGSFTQVDHLTS